MILVDSSVWINCFVGKETRETALLDHLLGQQQLITGDIILTEVLQGFRSDKDFMIAKDLMSLLPWYNLCNPELAIQAAENFRLLRRNGITIGKTIDVIIATFCISKGIPLLHQDRDFQAFQQHLGLEVL